MSQDQQPYAQFAHIKLLLVHILEKCYDLTNPYLPWLFSWACPEKTMNHGGVDMEINFKISDKAIKVIAGVVLAIIAFFQ
ncbi:hypothetical protein [Neobacillus vireti]|uniref:hypothetical protein n=1 Tax=Neobacillus vireti TaxID=220686 RepID=UPI00300029A8